MFPLDLDPMHILAIGMITVVGGILIGRWHAFLALLAGAFLVALLSPASDSAADRIATGFGNTCRSVGILIGLAAVIGRCLLESGAAERIVVALQRVLGERHASLALVVSGFVLGIPVYFDTVFYLLLPIARTLSRQTGRNYLLYIMSIILGATMAHSLVPPTPGPLLVAAELNVSIATMMQAGIVVGAIAVAFGYAYALWANRRWTIPMREPLVSDSQVAAAEDATKDGSAGVRVATGPPLGLSLAPILLPVLLLSLGALVTPGRDGATLPAWQHAYPRIVSLLQFVSDKHVALGMAAILAMLTMHRFAPSRVDRSRVIQDAISGAGGIVLITAAGGAFGEALRQSGIADSIKNHFAVNESGLLLLVIAFGVTAVVRMAQGSATVAMITAVGIVAPLVQSSGLPYHPVYVALAIGCGSKPIPWMNDSGFWVVTRMSGMTEGESLKTFSVALTLMGICGFIVTLLGATLLPMAR